MSISDDKHVNVVPLAELMNALYNVICLFRLSVDRYVPFFTDFFRRSVGSFICQFQQGHMPHFLSLPLFPFHCQAPCRIHHTWFHRMQQIHLPATLPHQIGGKIYHGSTIFGEVCCG